jgi:hypothetical protein
MSDYCLLPTKPQKNFAEYMATQYGKDYGERYLASVTNPYPTKASKKPIQKTRTKKATPQAVER